MIAASAGNWEGSKQRLVDLQMDSITQHLDDLQIKIRGMYERILYWRNPIWCLKSLKKEPQRCRLQL